MELTQMRSKSIKLSGDDGAPTIDGTNTRSHRWRQQPYEHGAEEPSPTGESVSIELDEPPPTTLKVTRVAKPDRGLDTPAVA